jgi:hypothetical protein
MTTIPRIYAPPVDAMTVTPKAPGPVPTTPPTTTNVTGKQADPPWFAKLMLMFPAEAVTAYTAGVQYFSGGHIWIVLVTLAALVIARWFALRPADGGPTNYLALVIASVSFLLWVGSTSDVALTNSLMEAGLRLDSTAEAANKQLQHISAFLILIWTWVMPGIAQLNPNPSTTSP